MEVVPVAGPLAAQRKEDRETESVLMGFAVVRPGILARLRVEIACEDGAALSIVLHLDLESAEALVGMERPVHLLDVAFDLVEQIGHSGLAGSLSRRVQMGGPGRDSLRLHIGAPRLGQRGELIFKPFQRVAGNETRLIDLLVFVATRRTNRTRERGRLTRWPPRTDCLADLSQRDGVRWVALSRNEL